MSVTDAWRPKRPGPASATAAAMRGARGMPFAHSMGCAAHVHAHRREFGTLSTVSAIRVAAVALILVPAPAAVQASACVDAPLQDPDSVDWMIHCGLPEQKCSVQPERSCAMTGNGDCCTLEHVAAHIEHDRHVRAQTHAAHARIILVVYDSDSVLDASVQHNFNQYGQTLHLASPFAGFGAKWSVAVCVRVRVCVRARTFFDLASAGHVWWSGELKREPTAPPTHPLRILHAVL